MTYSFPCRFVPQGSNVVIYGCGAVGRSYIAQLDETKYCNIVAMIDKSAAQISIPGHDVYDISQINEFEYDFCVVAIDSLAVSMQVRTDLINRGVKEEKLIFASLGLLESRVADCLATKGRLVLDNIGTRLDKRLTRLEILQYYGIEENRRKLDAEGIATLNEVQNFYERENRVFAEDSFYESGQEKIPSQYTKENVFCDENGYYCVVDGIKLYLGYNKAQAEGFLRGFWLHYESDNPHKYLSPEDDGIDIPEGAVIADIGAAEGYFGIKHLNRSEKVYFFETELEWIIELKKSVGNHRKAEIVQAFVGDGENELKLDDYFENDIKPTVVKIDVEGADIAVLRGMKKMLNSDEPLLLLIATYHRQEDWDRIQQLLNPDPENPRFKITHSNGYYWHLPDPVPPYFRRGIMRAEKI